MLNSLGEDEFRYKEISLNRTERRKVLSLSLVTVMLVVVLVVLEGSMLLLLLLLLLLLEIRSVAASLYIRRLLFKAFSLSFLSLVLVL